MKKKLLLSVVFTLVSLCIYAQYYSCRNYDFAKDQRAYSTITGGTKCEKIKSTASTAENIILPFTFKYCGINYTNARICGNGWVKFYNIPDSISSTLNNNDLASKVVTNALFPLWDGLGFIAAGDTASEVLYQLLETATDTVCVIQWKNVRWNGVGGMQNFQVWLYKNTNVIEFVYGKMRKPMGSLISASVGINSSNNTAKPSDFISITPCAEEGYVASEYNLNNRLDATCYLDSNTVFTFIPPTCWFDFDKMDITDISKNAAKIVWENNNADSFNLEWIPYFGNWASAEKRSVTVAEYPLTGLAASETYRVRLQKKCSETSLSRWSELDATTFWEPLNDSVVYCNNFDSFLDGPFVHVAGWTSYPNGIKGSQDYFTTASEAIWLNSSVGPTKLSVTGVEGLLGSSYYIKELAPTVGTNSNILISPLIELPQTDAQILTFYFKAAGDAWKNIPKFDVRISTKYTVGQPTVADFDSIVFTFNNDYKDTWRLVTIDLTPFKGKAIQTAFYLHSQKGSNACLFIDDFCIKKKSANNCVAPTHLRLNPMSITQNTASINWYGAGGNWEFKLLETRDTIFNPDTTGVLYQTNNLSEYTFSNLKAGTEYSFYMRSKCSATDSSGWVGPITFRTRCSPLTAIEPYYYEDFTGETKIPSCWRFFSNYDASTVILLPSDRYIAPAISFARIMKGRAPADSSVILIGPEISINDVDIKSLRTRFKSYANNIPLEVGYMTNPLNPRTFVKVETVTIKSAAWPDYIVRFDTITPNFSSSDSVFCIAFRHGGSSNASDISLDNIWIEPMLCKDITNLRVAGNAIYSVKLDFTTEASISRVWYREKGETSFTKYKDVSDTSALINALDPGKYYEFQAQSVCGGVFGALTDIIEGKTLCEEIQFSNLPYYESFDELPAGTVPVCFNYISSRLVGGFDNNGITKSKYYSGNQSLELRNGTHKIGNKKAITSYLLPAVLIHNKNEVKELQIRFMGQARFLASMHVNIRTDIDTISLPEKSLHIETIDMDSEWKQYKIGFEITNLSSINFAENLFIEFRHANIDSNQYINIDDLVIEKVPTCTEPQISYVENTTATTATFVVKRWSYAPSGFFLLDYKQADSSTWKTDTISIGEETDTSYILRNLVPQRTYNARVRTRCSGNDISPYHLKTMTFTTLQAPLQISPYISENFDSLTHLDWTLVNGSRPHKWCVGSAVAKPQGGKSIYISNDNGITNAPDQFDVYTYKVHFFRDIVMPETEQIKVSFDWKAVGTNGSIQDYYADYLQVFLIDVTETPKVDMLLNPKDSVSKRFIGQYNAWQKDSIYIPVTNPGEVKRLVFTWRKESGHTFTPPAAIDNILIEKVPCVAPLNLHVGYTHFDSLYINWDSPAPKFLMEYRKKGDEQWISDTVHTSPHSLREIAFETNANYDFRMRSYCTNAHISDPVAVAILNTLCKPDEEAPYYEPMTTITKCWEKRITPLNPYSANFKYGGHWDFERVGRDMRKDTAARINIGKNSNTNDWFISPIVDLKKSNKEVILEFDMARTQHNLFTDVVGQPRDNNFVVLVSSDDRWNSSKILRIWESAEMGEYRLRDIPNQLTHYRISLGKMEGKVRIAFYGESKPSDSTNSDIYIANVRVNLICPAIDSLIFDKISQTYATVSWNTKLAQKGGWELRIGAENNPTEELTSQFFTGTDTTATFNDLAPLTKYIIYYRSICGAGDSSIWKAEKFTTKFCDTTRNVSIMSIGNTSATVKWTPAKNQIGCEIAYGLQGTDFDDLIFERAEGVSEYELTNLKRDSDYKVYLRSICKDDAISDWGSEYTFITQGATCKAVGGLSVASVGSTTANIVWNKIEDQNQWQVSCILKDQPNTEECTLATSAFSKLTGLQPGTESHIKVRAICSGSDSSRWSKTITIKTSGCTKVTNVTASANENKISAAWTAGADENEWEVCLYTTGQVAGQGTIKAVNTAAYTGNISNSANTYTLAVRAKCSDNTFSDWEEVKLNNNRLNAAGKIKINLLPNPAKEHVTLSIKGTIGNVKVSIIDMNGSIVQTQVIYCNNEMSKNLNISNLAKGTYTIMLIHNDWTKTEKLIIY